MDLETWLIFIPAAFAINMAPGPNNILATTNGARFGFGAAMAGGIGRLIAFAGMIGLTIVGLGAVLAASELAFLVIKWVGALYLVWIGIKMFLARPTDPSALAVGGGRGRPTLMTLARHEGMVAAGNPKAILVFTAFFPQFLGSGAPVWMQLTAMGATFLVLEVAALAFYALAGRRLARVADATGGLRLINRLGGAALVGAGCRLALSRRESTA